MGLVKNWKVKLCDYTWSDGAYNAYEIVNYMAVEASNDTLIDILAKGKEKNKILSYITQCIHFFMLFSIFIVAISSVYRKKVKIEMLFIIVLTGAITFYAIWETCSRYMLQFYPVILLTAIQGIHILKIKTRFLNVRKINLSIDKK